MRHYLDHASTTPLRPAAVAAMREWTQRLGAPDGTGDPGRLHEEGRTAREAIEIAREQVAALAGVAARRLIFTSSATEAANSAILSAAASARTGGAIVCSAVEHSCVREASQRSSPVLDLHVDRAGRVDPEHLEVLLQGATVLPSLVNCQWANHEVGTVQPLAEVAAICQEYGVPLHVDAAAAFGHVATDVSSFGAHYVSVSAHKMGGPAGVGALILGPGVRLRPLLVGGSEERARRAGSENLLGIIGFGAGAAELLEGGRLGAEQSRASSQCAELVRRASHAEGVELLGPGDNGARLPHVACLSMAGVLGEAVLLSLDRKGIAAHSGSACSSEALEPSPVLAAMGWDPDRSLRLSVGWSTADTDIDAFGRTFPAVVAELRALGSSH
ncbi:MAG: cysteine desulfurase family protein [Acidimicrobiales bacterium]